MPNDSAAPPASEHVRREGITALRNGLKLGLSLLLTWGVAIFITFRLPRYLGPAHWGFYKYGFEYAATLAVFVGFGVDTYISREVAVRPKHASDFFLGVVLSRALVMVPLFLFGWFHLEHKLPEEQLAAAMFGASQIFVVMNQTFQQTLQAASKVGGLAVANVVAKILWGGGTFAAVLLQAPFWVLPIPMIAAEALKAAFLYAATRDAVGLSLRLDFGATRNVMRISLPFFIANAAVTLGSTIDVVVLRELVPKGSYEVGWYSAAREIARLSALLSPVLSGVLVPMMSRAKHRSEDEFFGILRRGIEGVNVVAIPLTLLLALSADFAVPLVLKDKFIPAALSLRWLAPTFVLSYANVLLWIALMILDRRWTIMIISFIGLALLPGFILVITAFTKTRGDGATGMGVAMALTARELVIVLVFLWFLGKRALDARSIGSIVKSFAVSGVVVVAHIAMARLGPVRLVLDALLYLVLAFALRILRPSDILLVLRMTKDRKRAQAA